MFVCSLGRTKTTTGYSLLQRFYDWRKTVLNGLTLATTQLRLVSLYMNFLAHAYLSFHHPQVMVGNMISDFVKGKTRYTYPTAIQYGIELHRRIDCFTDTHPVTQQAKQVFKKDYRLYSGAFMDIAYDHFLANDAQQFSDISLFDFSQDVYTILDSFSAQLPSHFLYMLPYMKTENWLYGYSETKDIERSFKGLVRRSSFLSESDTAFQLFMENYIYLQECYAAFFTDLKQYAQQQFKIIVT